MYRIEYDIETGLVHNLAIIEDENYPETLVDGVAYYEGDIPEDVEGYEKVLYYKLVNTQENPEGISTFAVWEGNLYAEYKPIEGWMELADAKDVADLFIQSQKPKGLRFKAGDNSVFAKTMKALVLGTDDFTVCVVARTEGSQWENFPMFGYSKPIYSASSMKIGVNPNSTSNDIYFVLMQGTSSENSIPILKKDTTTNLHHIVITRSGTLVTCIVNGRLVKSATQDRVLDFSNFIYDIANTSYFWGGAVFNYAMTQAESNKLLWNGGRYDEVRLPYHMVGKNNIVTLRTPTIHPNEANPQNAVISNASIGNFQLSFSGGADAGRPSINVAEVPRININNYFNIEFDYECISDTAMLSHISGSYGINHNFTRGTGKVKLVAKSDGQVNIYFRFNGTVATNIKISNIKISIQSALLEYKPENIRVDRMINTGTLGSAYDLIYSLPTKPTIIYEAPYKDKIVLEDKTTPDFHPIAVGQRCYTSDGKILEAKLPVKGSEWAVSDWKQTSV